MKLLVVFLAVIAVSFALKCQNPIGGMQYLVKGIDMVRGDQNQTLPIWDMSDCDDHQKFVEPNSGLTFDVPDALSITSDPQASEKAAGGLMSDYQKFKASFGSMYRRGDGLDINKFKMSLSDKYNAELAIAHKLFKGGEMELSLSYDDYSMYRLSSLPPLLLQKDRRFDEYTQKLPSHIKTPMDQKMFNNLVLNYGTHFFVDSLMGGFVHMDTFIQRSYAVNMTTSYISEQLKLEFHSVLFNISAGGYHNRTEIHVDQSFKEHIESHVFFRGGDKDLQDPATSAEWKQSLYRNPQIMQGTISDLSTLLDDMEAERYLKLTIAEYLDTGKLPPCRKSMDYDRYYKSLEHKFKNRL
eukprot:TRINITY_DN3692_c0_g1_i1.p1 TRINITY_DN3692_c0_g1~~TRINITY_DN3692_c0_g1_i1.p1  ORF type:complete len:354 (+),score=96.50 TRINITY_DN3692_c0_g1_i1:39-1100(+)